MSRNQLIGWLIATVVGFVVVTALGLQSPATFWAGMFFGMLGIYSGHVWDAD